MTAAQVYRVHEQPGDDDVKQLCAGSRPARSRDEHDGCETCKTEREAQREKSERRRMLETDFRRNEARPPHCNEIPRKSAVPGASFRTILRHDGSS